MRLLPWTGGIDREAGADPMTGTRKKPAQRHICGFPRKFAEKSGTNPAHVPDETAQDGIGPAVSLRVTGSSPRERAMLESVENRSAERESRERPLIPCATCRREIPRAALTCIYCGQPTPVSRIRRTVARKRRNPVRCTLGSLIMLGGFASFFYYVQFPWNVAIGLTALVVGVAITRGWECDHCRARVDRGSAECPRCSLPFARPMP